MPTQSELTHLPPKERRDYGFLRVRDAAFDAVSALWDRRQREGMTQAQITEEIDADAGWVSRNLRGPGNWTMKTFGAFVEALNGEVQISIRAAEDPLPVITNYHAYVDYEPEMPATTQSVSGMRVSGSTIQITPSGNAPQTKRRGPTAVILIP
jgi:hypothetical protein